MSVLDMLDRLEREATPPNRTFLTPDGKITVGDKELLVLSRNHLRALLDVARAASQSAPHDHTAGSRYCPGCHLDNRLKVALAPLTTPSEQKEET